MKRRNEGSPEWAGNGIMGGQQPANREGKDTKNTNGTKKNKNSQTEKNLRYRQKEY